MSEKVRRASEEITTAALAIVDLPIDGRNVRTLCELGIVMKPRDL